MVVALLSSDSAAAPCDSSAVAVQELLRSAERYPVLDAAAQCLVVWLAGWTAVSFSHSHFPAGLTERKS